MILCVTEEQSPIKSSKMLVIVSYLLDPEFLCNFTKEYTNQPNHLYVRTIKVTVSWWTMLNVAAAPIQERVPKRKGQGHQHTTMTILDMFKPSMPLNWDRTVHGNSTAASTSNNDTQDPCYSHSRCPHSTNGSITNSTGLVVQQIPGHNPPNNPPSALATSTPKTATMAGNKLCFWGICPCHIGARFVNLTNHSSVEQQSFCQRREIPTTNSTPSTSTIGNPNAEINTAWWCCPIHNLCQQPGQPNHDQWHDHKGTATNNIVLVSGATLWSCSTAASDSSWRRSNHKRSNMPTLC